MNQVFTIRKLSRRHLRDYYRMFGRRLPEIVTCGPDTLSRSDIRRKRLEDVKIKQMGFFTLEVL